MHRVTFPSDFLIITMLLQNNILSCKNCTILPNNRTRIEPHQKRRDRKCPVFKAFRSLNVLNFLFKLANKILSLYFLVLVLWFYLVLYVFNCPKSIGCTEQCYQIVITSLLSIKDSRNILISVNYTINLYIFITNLVDNYIIFPYRIFIICPKADPFG